MKRTISVMACLAVFCTSHLVANSTVATIPSNDLANLSLLIDAKDPNTAKDPAAKKEVLEMIPSVDLTLKTNEKKGILKVTLKGEISDNLEWVIFQPKSGVISRLSSHSKINEIKIDTLKKGAYVLMIKDAQGRALFSSFEKT